MKVDVRKIGNSLGVILPRPVLESWGVGEGDQLEVTDKGVRPRRKGGLAPQALDELKRSIALAVVRDFTPAQIRAQILANLHRWRKQGAWVSAYDEWRNIARRGDDGELVTHAVRVQRVMRAVPRSHRSCLRPVVPLDRDDIGLGLLEQTERDVARARLSRRQHDRCAAHREGERTRRRALHEGASFDGCHQTFSPLAALRVRRVKQSRALSSGCLRKCRRTAIPGESRRSVPRDRRDDLRLGIYATKHMILHFDEEHVAGFIETNFVGLVQQSVGCGAAIVVPPHYATTVVS